MTFRIDMVDETMEFGCFFESTENDEDDRLLWYTDDLL